MSDKYYMLNTGTARRNTALTMLTGGAIAVGLLFMVQPNLRDAKGAPTTVRLSGSLLKSLEAIGKSTCVNNSGFLEVVIKEGDDMFTFRCRDGMSLRDSLVTIKPEGEQRVTPLL